MAHRSDPGYRGRPFSTLARNYPGPEVYPYDQFRVEWGPIFHRGRLDGKARVLVIGQDPAQHEAVVRRILVGEAGRLVQGLVGKLGITTSYVLINTYLYSVYGTVKAAVRRDPRLVDYRNRWIDGIMATGAIEAVITLGTAAKEAWELWKATPRGQASTTPFAAVTHPTQPESSGTTAAARASATKKMLANWNLALQALAPGIFHPDQPVALKLYGEAWADGERLPIPAYHLPAGTPVWMFEDDGWAQRKGGDQLAKRRNITITIPKHVIP
ncbi:MAG: hypothetical protein KBH07_13545 [Flavobacteriales bacterium]|nr:hypothetical protein [Flavobacteriales bacterium]